MVPSTANRVAALSAALMMLLIVPALASQESVELPGTDRAIAPEPEQVYSIGSIAGEEWETFGEVDRVAFDREGNLYVLDRQNFRVVVVDPEGNLVREVGSEGDGPGELRFPLGFVVAPDGGIAVLDMGHQAFVVYDAEGGFVGNARNDFQSGVMGGDIYYHPRGGAVGTAAGIRVTNNSGRQEISGGGSAPVRFVPFVGGGDPEQLYEAWRPPRVAPSGGSASVSTGGGGTFSMRGISAARAFEPALLTGVLPDGRVVLSDSSTYALKLISGEGGLQSVIRRPIAPRRVTRRDEETEKARQLENLESGAGGAPVAIMRTTGGSGGSTTQRIGGDALSDMMRERIEGMVFAEEVPVIADLAVDWEGRIWVERTGRRVGEDGPTDLITADGRYLGTIAADGVRIPDAFGPGGLIAYIERDEFDVPTIVVKRLPVG
jgi:6-bladed beta-propeller